MNSVQENSSGSPLVLLAIFLAAIVVVALISAFSGWVNGVYLVPKEQVFMVLGSNLKWAALFGAAIALVLACLNRSAALVEQFVVSVAIFLVFTLAVPVTAYIGWMIWR